MFNLNFISTFSTFNRIGGFFAVSLWTYWLKGCVALGHKWWANIKPIKSAGWKIIISQESCSNTGLITRVSQKKAFFYKSKLHWVDSDYTWPILSDLYSTFFFWEVVLTSEIGIENSETWKLEVAWLFLPFSAFF